MQQQQQQRQGQKQTASHSYLPQNSHVELAQGQRLTGSNDGRLDFGHGFSAPFGGQYMGTHMGPSHSGGGHSNHSSGHATPRHYTGPLDPHSLKAHSASATPSSSEVFTPGTLPTDNLTPLEYAQTRGKTTSSSFHYPEMPRSLDQNVVKASLAIQSAPGDDENDNRTRNARAQKRHREKRKQHVKELEGKEQALNALVTSLQMQLKAYRDRGMSDQAPPSASTTNTQTSTNQIGSFHHHHAQHDPPFHLNQPSFGLQAASHSPATPSDVRTSNPEQPLEQEVRMLHDQVATLKAENWQLKSRLVALTGDTGLDIKQERSPVPGPQADSSTGT